MFTRRNFIRSSALGLPAFAALNSFASGESAPSGSFTEPSKTIPLCSEYDVVVCGGGPAGTAAAVTAARNGAKTLILEQGGCLGGVWTRGQLAWIFDFKKNGVCREIVERLNSMDAKRGPNPVNFVYEIDPMKLVLEEMCAAAGADILYFSKVSSAHVDSAGRLKTVVADCKGGRRAFSAKVFIDCTGDGDLACLAGASYAVGHADGHVQPATLNAIIEVADAAKLGDCISFYSGRNYKGHVQCTKNFLKDIEAAGVDPSYAMPTLFQLRGNILLLMANHEYGVKCDDVAGITKATLRARAEIYKIMKALGNLGGKWADSRVIATAEQIGIREGRRVKGLYEVSREDLIKGARHPDSVARAVFGVDIHAPTREKNRAESVGHGGIKTLPYDIPLRALISADVDGLMMAGRCISGDRIAHASYRVTGTAVATGQGAGYAAARAIALGVLPRRLNFAESVLGV